VCEDSGVSVFRHRPQPVAADVGEGFVASEAPALQSAIRSGMTGGERKQLPLPIEVWFASGAGERIVVGRGNQYVGFVPISHRASLRGQLIAAGKAGLRAPGMVYRDGDLFRVWVGVLPPDSFPAIEPGYDELPAPQAAIFGIPLQSFGKLRRDQ
jgi:hypothetical protein